MFPVYVLAVCFTVTQLTQVLSVGIPTSVPSSLPWSEPSGQPSTRPTLIPSAQPSQPTEEPSGLPSTFPSSQPTTEPSSSPSGEPTSHPTSPSAEPSGAPSGQPTGEPSGEPSNEPSGEPSSPSGQPTDQPSDQPTNQPTTEPSGQPSSAPTSPSGQPSGEPSGQPSSVPSGQPSSLPTHIYPQSLEFEGGRDSSTSVIWDALSLGYANNSYPLYLSVDVFPTNYENKANQYATVKVNGNVILLHCTPDESCGTEWFSCLFDYDVSSYRLEPMGGSLSVEVSSTGVNSGPCDYLTNYSLYTRMFLRSALPTSQPSSEPSSQPSTEPSNVPTGQPTSNPSGAPTPVPMLLNTGEPSAQPTATPSGEPSSQPSSVPTVSSPHWSEFCGGGNDTHPVQFEWSQLGYANQTDRPLYLGVRVYPTNYEASGAQWATVIVNSVELVTYCTPDETCGDSFYNCVVQADVRSHVMAPDGGSLTVTVSSTGVNGGPCDHAGFPLYVCMELSDYIPSNKEDRFPNVWVLVSIGALLFFITLLILCYCKASNKGSKSSQYAVTPDGNEINDVDLEFNPRPKRLYSPSGSGRRPLSPSTAQYQAELSARRFKLQSSGRYNGNDDEDTPLRPLRGTSRDSMNAGEDDPQRVVRALERSRSIQLDSRRKKYSFDGF